MKLIRTELMTDEKHLHFDKELIELVIVEEAEAKVLVSRDVDNG